MGMKDIIMIIIFAAAMYSLKDDTMKIISCDVSDYGCLFPKLLKFSLVLFLLYISSKLLE